MGNILNSLYQSAFGNTNVKILMIGIGGSGKTTVLYNMKLGEAMPITIPTIGFNEETIVHRQVNFSICDVGGSDQINPLWRHFGVGARSVIFVVDSSDRQNMQNAHYEFWRFMDCDELTFKEILIYANKQDIPDAMTVHEITQKLELDRRRLPRNVTWYVQECSATTGSGLFDGLTWLANKISHNYGIF